jgi:hypothetical protein
MDIKFQLFGSISSQDYDVLVFIDKIPSIRASGALCKLYDFKLATFFKEQGLEEKPVNTNLAVVKDGNIIAVFKGTPDEVNNSAYSTYMNFKQYCPPMVHSKVARNSDHKLLRSIRIILSLLSRTEHRSVVKLALINKLFEGQVKALESISFPISTGAKKQSNIDIYKTIAFQIGQTLALFNNVECYSKEEIKTEYPLLSPFLDRDVENYNFSNLEAARCQFLMLCKNHLERLSKATEFDF